MKKNLITILLLLLLSILLAGCNPTATNNGIGAAMLETAVAIAVDSAANNNGGVLGFSGAQAEAAAAGIEAGMRHNTFMRGIGSALRLLGR